MATSDTHVVGVRNCHVSNLARVVVKDDPGRVVLSADAPKSTLHVIDEPNAVAADYVQNVGGVALFCLDHHFFERLDSNLKNLISFSSIDLSNGPPLDVAVCATRNDVVLNQHNCLNAALVERHLCLSIENQMRLHKVTLPEDHRAVLSTRKDLTIGKLLPGRRIREFQLPVLGNFTLEFQTSKSLRHFPEFDVTRTTCEQNIIRERRK